MAGTRSLGSLTLDLIARIGGFSQGLSQAEREAQRRARNIQNSFRSMQRTISGVFGAIGAGALIRSIVRNTAETEHALAQLDAALRSTGNAAGYSKDQLVDMAQRMAESTTHSVNEISRAQTRLLSYTTLVGETYPRALQAAIDQSVRLGISTEQSAEIIGRALETPSRGVAALTRQGFSFTESQKSMLRSLEQAGRVAEAQAIVLEVLEESYGGAAAAARNTFGGALTAVQNALGDLLSSSDGLPSATKALNEFADILRDPGVKQGADALFSTVINGAAKVVEMGGKTIAGIGVELGLVGDEIERLEDQIRFLEEQRRSLLPFVLHTPGFLGEEGFGVLTPGEIDAKIRELTERQRQLIDAMGRAPSVAAGPTGPALPPPPSEAFLKLEASLQRQIALFGKTGEAAKLAYDIQIGAIEGLRPGDEARLLSLASQYDQLVKNAEAEKELAQARKQLEQAYKSQVESLERQIALTGEVTELERIRYEISSGALKGVSAEQVEYLESLARQADALRDAEEAQAEWEKTLERGKSLTESLRTPLEVYKDTLAEVNELLEQGAISYETYSRAIKRAQEELDKATNQWTVFRDQAMRNTQDIIADTLVSGFEGGAKGIIKTFGEMIKQLTAQAVAADLAKKLFGNPQDSSDGGWIGAAFSFLGGFFGGARASGGPVSAGTMYRVNEVGPEYFVPNSSGTIVPLSKTNIGTQTNNFNISIAAPNGAVSMQTRQQLMADVARGIALANRRNN